MRNEKSSLYLCQLLVLIFSGVLVAVDVAGYWLVQWFLSWTRYQFVWFLGLHRYPLGENLPFAFLFLLSLYAASVPAYIALYKMMRLLKNIDKEEIFVLQNVQILNVLATCCMAVAIICLVSSLYYVVYLFVAVAAAFMMLLLKVIKHVFQRACAMQSELDFTI